MNERLRRALAAAHMTRDALAEATNVDPKTVQHWLRGRIPHARHRWKVAELLNVHEDLLWPIDDNSTRSAPGNEGAQQTDIKRNVQEEVPSLLSSSQALDDLLPHFSHAITQGIIDAVHELEEAKDKKQVSQDLESDDEPVNRREATRTIGVLGLQLLGLPVWEQLSKALTTSTFLDKTTVETLESITGNFWQLSETMAPSTLINPVVGHFEMIAQFLRSAPPLALYQPLSSLASEVAQIAARLFFDMKGYKESATCYNVSIELAQRAGNPVLQAVGLTRRARDLLQNGYPEDAHVLLQQAPQLSSQPGASVAHAYLAAVEAKAFSQLNEADGCTQKLDEATQFVEQIQPDEDFYWTSFDASLLGDFQGDCYLQLHRSSNAQVAFQDALQLSDPSALRHQASVIVGLANALMQQGELEQSCALTSKALGFTAQTQSWMIFQYILTFRNRLETWKNEACVKHLDEQIAYVNTKVYRFDRSALPL